MNAPPQPHCRLGDRHGACWLLLLLLLASALRVAPAPAAAPPSPLLDGALPNLQIEIPEDGMKILHDYHQVWGKPRPERIDVHATVHEGQHIYTNVALHLKGSFTFQSVDDKPSLTLNFDKFAPGQRFHGLDKIHLNNSSQDPTYLCEELAREMFEAAGVPAPRVGHARASLNGRNLGAYVVIEGANKRFLKRHFASVQGNLYDGGSGGDITKALKVDSGKSPEDRSDLQALVAATREPVASNRLARLERLLDMDRFLSFAALEVLLQHWDGYCMGPNNYRLFHDAAPDRDRMVFMPHGLDQILGVGSRSSSLQPHWNGAVAKALFSTAEGRRRYLERVGQIATNRFRAETMVARVDQLAGRLRPFVAPGFLEGIQFRAAVENLKNRIQRRVAEVQDQLEKPEQPLAFAPDGTVTLSEWRYKNTTPKRAQGRRVVEEGRDCLLVEAVESASSGSWRTTVLLGAGHYEFIGQARTSGLTENATNSGVILRVSGERSDKGLSSPTHWTPLRYEFEVQALMNVECVCEFRGTHASGAFDTKTLQLRRRP